MTNSQLSLSNIEKLVQISNVYGNVVVKGDVLVTFGKNVHKALGYSSQPEDSLTDYIVKLVDKFGEKELLNLDTGLEISLALLIHPNPIMALKILSKIRPNADSITLFLLFSVAQVIADEIKLFESLQQFNKVKQIENVGQAFQVTDAYKKLKTENIPDDVIQKMLNGYFQVLGTGDYGERLYFTQHPELLSMSADLHLAKICISAFMNLDERVVNEFMEIREYLSSFRKAG
jgi:hypothetical protein